MSVRRLVDFPYVLVRLRCDPCKRAGSYRLARLAVKYGAEILLDDLLMRLSADCPWRDNPRGTCGARFTDWNGRPLFPFASLLADHLPSIAAVAPVHRRIVRLLGG